MGNIENWLKHIVKLLPALAGIARALSGIIQMRFKKYFIALLQILYEK